MPITRLFPTSSMPFRFLKKRKMKFGKEDVFSRVLETSKSLLESMMLA